MTIKIEVNMLRFLLLAILAGQFAPGLGREDKNPWGASPNAQIGSWPFFPTRPPSSSPGRNAMHPLDPLTEDEIKMTVSIVKQFRPNVDWVFHSIILLEPPKSVLLDYFLQDRPVPTDSGIPRKSTSVVRDRNSPNPNVVVVNLSAGQVESWTSEDGKIAQFTLDEMFATEQLVKQDPVVKERCRQHGYTNMSLVEATSWPMGYIDDRPEYQGKRLAQMYMFGKNFEKDNANTHPFDFLPVVDIVAKKIIAIEELPTQSSIFDDGTNKTGVRTPHAEHNYDPSLKPRGYFRSDLKPVRVSQSGHSWTFTNYELKWQKFKMRLGFNGREGLVIYWVNYNDTQSGAVRPIFYRMSMSEMVVPYGDPRPPYHRRTAFDEGQYGLGYLGNSLRAQEDCLGSVGFLDAVLHNEKGEPVQLPKAVCIREEDSGIGWKHTNMRTNKPYITRRQRLAMTFIATIGHYDYIYTWNFYQDASIEFNVKLTGILSVNLLAVGANPAGHGTIVDDQINGPFHQHYFAVRLDPEVDGNQNTVVMADVVPGRGGTGSQTNPYGNGFTLNKTVFTRAADSRSNIDYSVRRTWLVTNEWPVDTSKQSVGWKLLPPPSPMLMLRDDSPLIKAAGFARYNTWVTPYKDDQLYAGGLFLKKSGLPEWVRQAPDANIANTDVVLWHVFDATHVPRIEDWPVMPVEEMTMKLEPFNFFRENPALDVPQIQKDRR